MGIFVDMTGQSFGKLAVICRAFPPTSNTGAFWLCRCECGNEKVVTGGDLRANNVRSCGCIRKEWAAHLKLSHGHMRGGRASREYKSWQSMWQRCSNTNYPKYQNYGGRCIDVCDRWQSFEMFLEDMGERPAGMSIDRFPDNNGNYEPNNCRWATAKQQQANRRCSKQAA